ncbi:MAG: hypothetical protein EXR52_07615 [Dehalococcoidia bacterium]|nr:hypothetical protein [Dehalococcoidia bacterium]
MAYALKHYHGFHLGWMGDDCLVSLEDGYLRVEHSEGDNGQSYPWRADIPYDALRELVGRSPDEQLAGWDGDASPEWMNGVLQLSVQLEDQLTPTSVLMSGPMRDLRGLAEDLMLSEIGLEPVAYTSVG